MSVKQRTPGGVFAHGWTVDRRVELAKAIQRSWPEAELLRDKRQGMTTHRVWPAGFPSVIVRMRWSRTIRERVKALAGLDGARREWRALHAVVDAGVPAPKPLLLTTLAFADGASGCALVTEDMGRCERAVSRLTEALKSGDARSAEVIESAVIEATARMLRADLTDEDHTLMNFAVTPTDRVVRLDVEFVKRGLAGARRASRVGRMLGRLIASHAFAAQQVSIARTDRFAKRLAEATQPGASALRRAKNEVDRRLEQQRRNLGVETRLQLPW